MSSANAGGVHIANALVEIAAASANESIFRIFFLLGARVPAEGGADLADEG
jgi:hypothetical protein